jgi:hypothetical protein
MTRLSRRAGHQIRDNASRSAWTRPGSEQHLNETRQDEKLDSVRRNRSIPFEMQRIYPTSKTLYMYSTLANLVCVLL